MRPSFKEDLYGCFPSFDTPFGRFQINQKHGTLIRPIVFLAEEDQRWQQLTPETALLQLKQQLRLLTQAGIHIPQHSYFYEPNVPFDLDGETRLFAEVEMVEGTRIPLLSNKDKVQQLPPEIFHELFVVLTALFRYLSSVISAKKEVMFDIFRFNQFHYGTTPSSSQPQMYLIDFEYATVDTDSHQYFWQLTASFLRCVHLLEEVMRISKQDPARFPSAEVFLELEHQAQRVASAFIDTYPENIEQQLVPHFDLEYELFKIRQMTHSVAEKQL